jgi:hypothetical protein
MKKNLTEQQQKFLDFLFMSEEEGGAGGDFVKAKKLAGYHPTYSTRTLVQVLKDEIEQAARDYFVQVAPRAAMKISGVMENPAATLSPKEVLAASKDLLDRAGLVKVDKIELGGNGGIFILPPKDGEE